MNDPYKVLGVSPGASEQEDKESLPRPRKKISRTIIMTTRSNLHRTR